MRLPDRPCAKALPLGGALLALAFCLPGCVAVRKPVADTPASATPSGSAPTEAEAPVPPAPEQSGGTPFAAPDDPAAGEAPDTQEVELEASGESAAEPDDDEPSGEPSPLDELAEVEPEVAPAELAKERAVVESKPTTFDIPIEINDKVLGWVDFFTKRYREKFQETLVRSGRYLPIIHAVFQAEGLPLDLAYLVHVESAYKPLALSRSKARGLFQFMAATGRRYGLRYDYWVDDRVDPEKAARAAAAYLRDLYTMFGDWNLALAAYNAGEGKVGRSLARTRTKSFWALSDTRALRRETRSYVPAILAATLISKDPGRYGFEFEPDPPMEYDTIEVRGAVDLMVLARCAGTDFETMRALNLALRRRQTPPDRTTQVRVPKGSGESTLLALDSVPPSSRVLVRRHRVRRGETLGAVSRRYGVPVAVIQKANGLGSRTMLRVGRVLTIPTGPMTAAELASLRDEEPGSQARASMAYRVRRGDSLSGIARRFGVTPQAIARASGIRVGSVLRVGQRLTIPTGRVATVHANGASSPRASAGRDRGIHTVRRGETLWRIAGLYRISVDELCALNGISRHEVLHPGTKLTVASN